jgi:hypothetical protein
MNLKKIIIYTLIGFSIVSCSKKYTEAEGVVYDLYTNTPVANAKVQFLTGNENYANPSEDEISYTNSDGSFYIKSKAKNLTYVYATYKTGYSYFLFDPSSCVAIKEDENNKAILRIEQGGKIVFKVHNVSPFNNKDSIFISSQKTTVFINATYKKSFVGMNVNTSDTAILTANIDTYFFYAVTKNGIEKDSVFHLKVPVGVTTLDINY